MRLDVLRGCGQQQVASHTSDPYLKATLARATFAPWYRANWPKNRTGTPDLAELPILDRSVVADHADEFLTGFVPQPFRRKVATGGSTGAPVAVWLDRSISFSEWRFMTRQWNIVGYRRGSWRVVLRGCLLKGDGIRPKVSFVRREVRLSTFHLSDETLDAYLSAIRQYEGAFLHAYPSSALRLAELCLTNRRPLPRFKALLLGSEGVTPSQRDTLASIYECSVYSWYGHTEKVLLGGECQHSRDYHLFPGYGFAEIVDEFGVPVTEPGTLGRLIGTGFLNHSAPLVRYDTGDLAAFAPSECECGWPGQRLMSIVGRTQDYVLTPSGAHVSIAALNLHSELYDGLLQIQYVQRESREKVLVRIAVARQWTEAKTRALGDALSDRLPSCSIDITRVRSVEMGPNGKAPIVIRTVR